MIKFFMFLVFSVFVTVVTSQECGECEEISFFCLSGLHAKIEGCGVDCECDCKCSCTNNTDCNDGTFCKYPKSPSTGIIGDTLACVPEDFEGRAFDAPKPTEPPAQSSMVWLPIVIVVVVIILLVVAFMVWKKKSSGEAKEEATEDANENEPLNEENV